MKQRIEGVANDRPLTSVDEDPSTKVISPSYLILGRQTTETYENEVLPLSNFTQKRLKFQETTYQTFWNIFYKEYLLQLQEYKHKNKSKDKIPQLGDIVHIKDDLQPKRNWRIGKVDELIEGKDGQIRVVKVRTPLGKNCTTLLRPVQHLYPLESANEPIISSTGNDTTQNNSVKPNFTVCSLINFVIIMFLCSIGLVTTVNNSIDCDRLSCLNISRGSLMHYNVYERPKWIGLNVYICQRRVDRLEFYENIFWQKSRKIVTSYPLYSKKACLAIGLTRTSADGDLRLNNNFFKLYSTGNMEKEKYNWMTVNEGFVRNTYLYHERIKTDGVNIETEHLKQGKCWFKDGYCRLKKKVMVWKASCFNNLKFVGSEICHHKNKRVFCAETDYDEISRETICSTKVIATEQGVYLQPNNTQPPLSTKTHHLNAAVIQHLTDKIQELEHKLNCLTHNSQCYVRNENVAFVHSIIHKYNREHNQPTLSEFEIDDLIKLHIKNVSNSLYISNGQSVFGSISEYFSNGIQGILNSIVSIFLVILCLIIAFKSLCYVVRRIRARRNNTYLNIGSPEQIHLRNLRH